MSMRSWTSLASVAVIAGMLGLPGGAARAEVTLEVLYAFPSFARFHEPIAQKFQEQHPDIKIEFRAPVPDYDEGHQLMLRQAITNQLPDIYYSGFHLLRELAETLEKRDQIIDLGPLFEAEPAEWRAENYSETLLALGKVNGKQYGVPFNASSPIMYYNRDLVKAAGGDPDNMPSTWDELLDLAKRINDLEGDVTGISYDVQGWPDPWLWEAMILQQGGRMVDENNKVAFGGEEGMRALQIFRRLVDDGGMMLIEREQSRQLFQAGKIGMYFDSPALMRQMTDMSEGKFALGSTTFPLDNKEEGGVPTGGNLAVILSQDEAEQKAAWEFIKFATGPEAQTLVVELSGYMPTNKGALGPDYLGPFYEANPNFKTIAEQMDRSRPFGGHRGNAVRLWRAQRDIINNYMRGNLTPEDALQQLVTETQAVID
ncbi:ABC transporter substrate-binding protein [Geminicoccus harenae]|uniref:ABC transporter substrate-binding protein n=2 Tax=Geminicoccus harenae TaxID=2498453 RepID=UPI001CC2D75F|nr:ABC transporter substrate-binding protein [Geminicoccus harenae]